MSLAGIAEKKVHLGRAEIAGIDIDHGLSRSGVHPDLIGALPRHSIR